MAERDAGAEPAQIFQTDVDPSTLFSFWGEPDAPLDEEVRLALTAAFEGVEWIDDLESSEDVLWGSVYRFAGHPNDVVIWAEDKGDLADHLIDEGLPDPTERARARASRWLIGVETFLERDEMQRGFQFQLKVLVEATVPGLVAVYDDNALVVRHPSLILSLVDTKAAPRPSNLYAIHAVSGPGGNWLHTHGLTRGGVAEIDLIGVPADDLREGYDLIDAVIDGLLGGLVPDAAGSLAIGQGLVVRVLPLEDAMALVPEDIVGGPRDRDGDMSDHGGARLVLFDPDVDMPPFSVLHRIADTGVVYKSRGETERQSELALERFGTFGQLFALRRGVGWRFHAKVSFSRASDPESTEHLWFEVVALRKGELLGCLMSAPVDVPDLRVGDEVWQPLERLTDWVIVTPEGSFDPEGAVGLLPD